MPQHITYWEWMEAFLKFGFEDGDGPNFTSEVAEYLRELGYEVEEDTWGLHNYMIMKLIGPCGKDLLKGHELGYEDPRKYLPPQLVAMLDEKFPSAF